MASIFDLRKELEEEKNKTKSYQEIENIGRERKQLQKQIVEERKKRQPIGVVGAIKRDIGTVIRGVKPVAQRVAKEVGKLQQEQINRDKQNKAIRKRGYNPNLNEKRGLGLF
jgi:Mg2+ and Co2+ transporter CorA